MRRSCCRNLVSALIPQLKRGHFSIRVNHRDGRRAWDRRGRRKRRKSSGRSGRPETTIAPAVDNWVVDSVQTHGEVEIGQISEDLICSIYVTAHRS